MYHSSVVTSVYKFKSHALTYAVLSAFRSPNILRFIGSGTGVIHCLSFLNRSLLKEAFCPKGGIVLTWGLTSKWQLEYEHI